jgi:hypothetical protein
MMALFMMGRYKLSRCKDPQLRALHTRLFNYVNFLNCMQEQVDRHKELIKLIKPQPNTIKSPDSAISISYGLDDRRVGLRVPVG